LIGCLFDACKTAKNTLTIHQETAPQTNNPSPLSGLNLGLNTTKESTITLLTDINGSEIQLPIDANDSTFAKLQAVNNIRQLYIGTLNYNWSTQPRSHLQLLSFNVPITNISMMEARSPEDVLIPSEHLHKLAIVEGFWGGGTLYQAQIKAVFKAEAMPLLFELLQQKNVDWRQYVEVLETKQEAIKIK